MMGWTTTQSGEWPEEMPVLTARDICQGQYDQYQGGRDQHCLLGWCKEIWGGIGMNGAPRQFKQALLDQCGSKHRLGYDVFHYNDSGTKTRAAAAWNAAIARCGYTEISEKGDE